MTLTHITKSNFEKEVLKSKSPVILDFYADWCGPCQMLGPVFEAVSNEYKGKLKFLKLNTEENRETTQQFQIQGIPAMVLINKGKEIGRIVGFVDEETLKEKITNII